jgi:hypothetical protein
MSFKNLIPILFACLFISCSSDDEISKELRELSEARSTWQSFKLKNYSMNERLSCYCGGLLEWKVFVKNGIKDKVEYEESPTFGQTYDDIFGQARTVDDVFDFIEELLGKDLGSLIIEYDQVYGFPSTVSVDYNERTADDEIAYLYTNFEILN